MSDNHDNPPEEDKLPKGMSEFMSNCRDMMTMAAECPGADGRAEEYALAAYWVEHPDE